MGDEIKTGTALNTDFGTTDRLSFLTHDIHRIANSLSEIMEVQKQILRLALDSQAQKKEMAEKMKEVFRRPPER